jgi:hypothetical protein
MFIIAIFTSDIQSSNRIKKPLYNNKAQSINLKNTVESKTVPFSFIQIIETTFYSEVPSPRQSEEYIKSVLFNIKRIFHDSIFVQILFCLMITSGFIFFFNKSNEKSEESCEKSEVSVTTHETIIDNYKIIANSQDDDPNIIKLEAFKIEEFIQKLK